MRVLDERGLPSTADTASRRTPSWVAKEASIKFRAAPESTKAVEAMHSFIEKINVYMFICYMLYVYKKKTHLFYIFFINLQLIKKIY